MALEDVTAVRPWTAVSHPPIPPNMLSEIPPQKSRGFRDTMVLIPMTLLSARGSPHVTYARMTLAIVCVRAMPSVVLQPHHRYKARKTPLIAL